MSFVVTEIQGFKEPDNKNGYFALDFVNDAIVIEEPKWGKFNRYRINATHVVGVSIGRTLYSNKIKNRYLKGAIFTGVLFFLVNLLWNGEVYEALRWGGVGFAVSLIYKFLFKRNRPQRKYIHPIMAIDYIEDETKELKTITIIHHQSSLKEAIAFKRQVEEALLRTARIPEALAPEKEIQQKRENEMRERENEIQECIRQGITQEPSMMKLEHFKETEKQP